MVSGVVFFDGRIRVRVGRMIERERKREKIEAREGVREWNVRLPTTVGLPCLSLFHSLDGLLMFP